MNQNKNLLLRFAQSINWQYLAKIATIAFVYALGAKIAVSIPGVNKLATCAGRTHLNLMLAEYGILEHNY